MTQTEALKLALEFADDVFRGNYKGNADEVITAIKETLAQPEQICGLDVVLDESMPPNTFKLAQPEQQVDWEKLYRLEVKKKEALAAKYERDIKPLTRIVPMAQPEQEPVAGDMTAERAAYFVRRFKHEEKLLGPNEQAALDFVISMLEAHQEQEPMAMKFKIYKPTVPDPVRQGINNALLPWVYDQDRSSGFDASMWVTPVATLPPQRKPLTDEPNLFWNDDDPEMPYDSIDEFLNEEWCNGGLEVGEIRTVQRAIRLPNVTVRVTAVSEDGEIDYAIEAAHGIKE